jgi:hypothetical protein
MSASGTKRTSAGAAHMSALGVKRTCRFALHMSANDPKRTWRGTANLHIRDFTTGRGSDVDGPIRHAKPDRRTRTQEVPHTRAAPHRQDIHQPPLAAALE